MMSSIWKNFGTGGKFNITSTNGTTNVGSTSITVANHNRLTSEELVELDNLRRDRQLWVKQQKLQNFQKLPPHLRQDIVDESYLRDFIDNINDMGIAFVDQDRLAELETKKQLDYINSVGASTYWPVSRIRSHIQLLTIHINILVS